MNKIFLNGVDTKRFINLIKKSASMDNMIFININGAQFESSSYNKNKSALKNVSADLEKFCNSYKNSIDDLVKIQFSNASKLIQSLQLVNGSDDVNVVFHIEDNNYAKKVVVSDSSTEITTPCADKEAVDFLEIPEAARKTVFEDMSKFQFGVDITDNEFKYINQLFNLNKDSVRIFFSFHEGDVYISEIEGTDENVRKEVNDIVTNTDTTAFLNFEKLYSKKLNINNINNESNTTEYIQCFNKQYFALIDSEKSYNIEFHTNKVKFVSDDEETGVKTYVILTPVRFA